MSNADKIRNMTDDQLARFLWTWKINSVTLFLAQGGQDSMTAKEMQEWLHSNDWVCPENKVGEDFLYDQDFNLKETKQ